MNCSNDDTFVYCKINGSIFVGTDEYRKFQNGLVAGAEFKGIIKIPDFYQGEPIVAVGQYAFTGNLKIENIIIGENVKEIKEYAFGDLPNCKTVFIPASVEILGPNSLYFYNMSLDGAGQGLTQIFFAPNSRLKYVESTIGAQKRIQIFSPSIINPICNGVIMSGAKIKELFSPYSFKFCNIKSRACRKCTLQWRSNTNNLLFLVIFAIKN